MPIYIGSNPLGVFEVDFEVTTPQVDQYLKYDGTKWINSPLPQGQSPSGFVVVNSIASLRALTPNASVPLLVTGFSAQNDGGGGIFFWDATDNSKMLSSVSIANGGTGYVPGSLATLNATDAASTAIENRAVVYVKTVSATTGAATSVIIVRWGKYTTATLNNPITTSSTLGSGLTLNAVWANLDNGGTIISSSVSSIGKWKRDFTGAVSTKWFGALTTGNAQPAIQKAVAYHKHVYITPGVYGIYDPIVLFDESILEGYSSGLSELYGSTNNIGNPLIAVNHKATSDSQLDQKNVRIKRIGLLGYCTNAIMLCRGTYCILEDIRIHNTYNTDHVMYCEFCWNTTLRNIHFTSCGVADTTQYTRTPGSACLFIGGFASSLHVENMITASTNPYGILMDGPNGQGSSHSFRNITIQGHTEVGVYIKNNASGPTHIHGMFSESCKITMRLGEKDTGKTARAVSLMGCSFATSTPTNKGAAPLWIDLCHGVDITGCTFGTSNTLDNCTILFNEGNVVRISGCFWGSFPIEAITTFRRISTLARADVYLVDQSMTTGTKGSSLVMRPDVTGTANYGRIATMKLDANGAWLPTLTTIPVHSTPPA